MFTFVADNVTLLKKEEFRACADIQISNTANVESQKRAKGTFWSQRNTNSIEKPLERRKDDKDFKLKSAKPDSYRYSLKGKKSYSFFSFDISPNSYENSVNDASENTSIQKKIFNKNR